MNELLNLKIAGERAQKYSDLDLPLLQLACVSDLCVFWWLLRMIFKGQLRGLSLNFHMERSSAGR